MKLRTTFYAVAVASLLCASAQADWVNTLKPPGKPAGKVKVVKAGKPQGGIQLPDQPNTARKPTPPPNSSFGSRR